MFGRLRLDGIQLERSNAGTDPGSSFLKLFVLFVEVHPDRADAEHAGLYAPKTGHGHVESQMNEGQSRKRKQAPFENSQHTYIHAKKKVSFLLNHSIFKVHEVDLLPKSWQH